MAEFEVKNLGVDLTLSESEIEILIDLISQVLELFGDFNYLHHKNFDDPFAALMDFDIGTEKPSDPILQRLMPDAYQDEEDSLDFRRFTQNHIQTEKQISLNLAREQLLILHSNKTNKISGLPYEQWLIALNDVRLALGTRLKIDENSYEYFEKLPENDKSKPLYAVYFWLGSLQEQLLESISQIE